jgi:hypothetical protein
VKAVENLTDPVLGLYWIYQLTSVRHKLQPALDWGMTPPQWPFDRCPISPLSVRFRCGFAPLWLIAFPRVTRSPVGIAGCPFAPLTVVVACIYCTGAKDLYLDPAQFKPISHTFVLYQLQPTVSRLRSGEQRNDGCGKPARAIGDRAMRQQRLIV